MTEQPGYDALAELYDRTFPTGYSSEVEKAAVGLFADELRAADVPGPVVDVGCGTGHQAHDLASRGLEVIGVDPSIEMLQLARQRFPDLTLAQGDAHLRGLGGGQISGVLARYSLIHVPPEQLAGVLSSWAARLAPGGVVLTAFQALPSQYPEDVQEFDHAVAPAWRWKPDAMAAALADVGLTERWRIVTQPSQDFHRFPECHLLHVRAST